MTAGPLVVVGDSLLDQDWTGSVNRLAPDAPVPVVEMEDVWLRPGGAALTALLAARGGSPVVLVTALADDQAGRTIERLLAGHVEVHSLPLRGGTPTKTRVSGSAQPLVRLDRGNGVAVPAPLPEAARRLLSRAGAVVVSDYGRGMTALPGLAQALGGSRAAVLWDPHPRGAAVPSGCCLVTPNAAEAQALAGTTDPVEVRRRWGAAAVAVTCGAAGVRLADQAGATAIEVPLELRTSGVRRDTCGAGDQLVATAAEVLRTSGSLREAVAAGVTEAARYVQAGGAAAVSTLDTTVCEIGRAPAPVPE